MRLRFETALLLPVVIILAVLVAYPAVDVLWLSFTNTNLLTGESTFVGLKNFVLLSGDPVFREAAGNSALFTLATTSFQVVLGILVALLLGNTFRFKSAVVGIVILPYLLPSVVAAIVFKWAFDPFFGIFNYLLLSFGVLSQPVAWFGSVGLAMPSVIAVSVWKFTPFAVVLFRARLRSIPRDLYEAAALDGASALRRFFDITLPQLRGVLFVVLLLRAIWMFREFEIIWLLTGGGPARATQTLPVEAFVTAFLNYGVGAGAAVAVVMFCVLIAFSSLYFKFYRFDHD